MFDEEHAKRMTGAAFYGSPEWLSKQRNVPGVKAQARFPGPTTDDVSDPAFNDCGCEGPVARSLCDQPCGYDNPPTAADLTKEVLDTLSSREGTHGEKQANMQAIADLWNVYIGANSELSRPLTGRDVCNMMVLMKIARQMFGDPLHKDHFVDMAGYAAIGGECALAEKADK